MQLKKHSVAFLMQYFPMLYSLPGGFEPNSELRRCAADFHWNYPAALTNPMKCVYDFRERNKDKPQTYTGDLEADYFMFLSKVQKAAKENQVDAEFSFP